MTRTHPNQSLDTFISLIILNKIWQFAAFPCILVVRKAAKHKNKNLSSKSVFLILTVSTSAFIQLILLVFSSPNSPNSVAPPSAYKPTHNPQFLQSLWRRANARNVSFFTLYSGQFTFSTQLLTLNYQGVKAWVVNITWVWVANVTGAPVYPPLPPLPPVTLTTLT